MTQTIGETSLASFAQRLNAIGEAIGEVVTGKPDVVRNALICLFSGGHLLIEDVPGVGKTSLARALAGAVGGSSSRIQFTPDLLPTDITGVSIFNQRSQTFEFKRGPIFANVVIADEINRASPKTQAALLEVMEEGRVTVDGVSHPAPAPFLVIATQNPLDMDGTYPLPEAQLDRFAMRLTIGYPDHAASRAMLRMHADGRIDAEVAPIVNTAMAAEMVVAVESAHVSDALCDYVTRIVEATRAQPDVSLGASPRAAVALMRAARARAAAHGHGFVRPDDVKALAVAVLAHRLRLRPDAVIEGRDGRDVVTRVLTSTAVPSAG